MPPKGKRKAKQDGLTDDDRKRISDQTLIVQRAADRACTLGMISRTQGSTAYSKVPKALKVASGSDIHRRTTIRKSKYLFALPGRLNITTLDKGKNSPQLGRIVGLDTLHPTLYIEFPDQGELKLCGAMLHTTNSYLTFRAERSKKQFISEDTFNSIVVFPRYYWIGLKDQNPDETPRPLPTDISQELQPIEDEEDVVEGEDGGDEKNDGNDDDDVGDDDDDAKEHVEDDEDDEKYVPRATSRTKRGRAGEDELLSSSPISRGKRPRVDDADDNVIEIDDD